MSRATLATGAAAALLALTAATWLFAERSAPPWVLAVVAFVKLAIIGWVFLEFDRTFVVWPLVYLSSCAAILGAVVALIG